ncbi:hypothetical protein PYCCODRAFT_1435168 [Trametes coccinea BRFM310]|uniref:Secreted protein n=1 Tax=Trametes coccinea (strain BRFM310) TaxID=1353009 RepID=A0A1Y2IQB6_TRAC3|nr:hypothetical protein PYCCODRAFT_1435168 [Trametes coccinea BRFM310]
MVSVGVGCVMGATLVAMVLGPEPRDECRTKRSRGACRRRGRGEDAGKLWYSKDRRGMTTSLLRRGARGRQVEE